MTQLLDTPIARQPTDEETLVDVLQWRSHHHPCQIAYTFLQDGESEISQLTYAELDQQARSIAAVLQSRGGVGERVLLIYPPGLEFIAAFWGCLYAGAIAVPICPPRGKRKQSSVVQAIAQDAQAMIALTTEKILSTLQSQWGESSDFSQIQWLTPAQALGSPEAWQFPEITLETLAFFQYTSGSTGAPKGVMVAHGNLLHNCHLLQSACHISAASRILLWLPHYHDMGLVSGILLPLYVGCPAVLMAPTAFIQQPIRWLQAISNTRATHSGAPDFAYRLCVEKIRPEQKATLDLTSWQVAFNGAESIQAKTMQDFVKAFGECGFHQQALMPCYGLAEATLGISWHPFEQDPRIINVSTSALATGQIELVEDQLKQPFKSLVSCGVPPSELMVQIVNPHTNQCCPNQSVGEIWVAGASITQGYWQQPALTQSTFHAYLSDSQAGPYLRTGDLGFIHDGELLITGRLKDVIIIRGQNYYPQDIEAAVQVSHPGLMPSHGAAFSVEVNGTEQLVIAQELKRSVLKDLDVDETFDDIVDAMLDAVLEQFELNVSSIVLLRPGHIPKTTSGKLQRSVCRTQFLEGTWAIARQWWVTPQTIQSKNPAAESSAVELTAPSIEPEITEEAIIDYLVVNMARYLEVSPKNISSHKTFARNGLNSITAINLTADLQQWLSIELEPVTFWEYTTIRSLSKYLYKLFKEGQNRMSQDAEHTP